VAPHQQLQQLAIGQRFEVWRADFFARGHAPARMARGAMADPALKLE
jgi:hypothetical protein